MFQSFGIKGQAKISLGFASTAYWGNALFMTGEEMQTNDAIDFESVGLYCFFIQFVLKILFAIAFCRFDVKFVFLFA